MAPVVQALARHQHLAPVVAVTGQHREMLDQVHDVFGIRPERDLDIIKPRQTLSDVTVNALAGLVPVIEDLSPAAVVVQGDTTTTFAAALAAYYCKAPVVHLEAGLRTGDRYSPFPEEMNRRLTTQLTDLHLAPTPQSADNLLREGVDRTRVVVTGNTVIDALLWAVDQEHVFEDPALADIDDDPRRVLLVTAHRRESWGAPMAEAARGVARLAEALPDVRVVFPVHKNPVVRDAVVPALAQHANVDLIEPLAYGPFARLMARAHVILSDSGGVQEEGPSLGTPVLVMRESTERPEGIEAGTAKLVGTDEDVIFDEVHELFRDPAAHERMAKAVNPYGDGQAAERAVAAVAELLGVGTRLSDFNPAEKAAR